jgi:hypothetical protein
MVGCPVPFAAQSLSPEGESGLELVSLQQIGSDRISAVFDADVSQLSTGPEPNFQISGDGATWYSASQVALVGGGEVEFLFPASLGINFWSIVGPLVRIEGTDGSPIAWPRSGVPF